MITIPTVTSLLLVARSLSAVLGMMATLAIGMALISPNLVWHSSAPYVLGGGLMFSIGLATAWATNRFDPGNKQ